MRVGDSPPFDEADTVTKTDRDLCYEPGLSDSGLADDRYDPSSAVDEIVEDVVEHGELEVPTDERGERLPTSSHAYAENAERAYGLGEPSQLGQAQVLEREAALDLRLRCAPDDYLPARNELLDPRGDIDRLAQRVVGVVALRPDDDRTGVDGDSNGELDAVGRVDVGRVLDERTLDRERCPDRSLGVVLVGDRRSEDGVQLVADVLDDRARRSARSRRS